MGGQRGGESERKKQEIKVTMQSGYQSISPLK